MNWTFFLLRVALGVILMAVAFVMNSIVDRVSIAREHHRRTRSRALEFGHPNLAQCAKR